MSAASPADNALTVTSDDHLLSRPNTARGRLQRAALAVLRQHEARGELPTSSRFVYYELKRAGVDTGTHAVRRDDTDVIVAVSDLRKVGLVPWTWIEDQTRSVTAWASAATITTAVLDQLAHLRLDCWDGTPPPVVITESRGVAGALRATAAEYLAPITSTNGQAGGYLRTDVAPLLTPGQRVLYLGDWNPAGSMIEADTRRVLERGTGDELDWHRLAITPTQAAATDPPLPPKPGTDRRYPDGRRRTSATSARRSARAPWPAYSPPTST